MEETTREGGKRERDERAERQRDREGELERESERLCFAECNAPSRTRHPAPLRHDDGGRPGVAIHGDVGLGPLTRENTRVCRWEQEGGEGDTKQVDGRAKRTPPPPRDCTCLHATSLTRRRAHLAQSHSRRGPRAPQSPVEVTKRNVSDTHVIQAACPMHATCAFPWPKPQQTASYWGGGGREDPTDPHAHGRGTYPVELRRANVVLAASDPTIPDTLTVG
jgi:hypothetical protein